MDFTIKYTECTACYREFVIPACPNAKVALEAFEKLVRFNRIRLKRIDSITAMPTRRKGPTHGKNETSRDDHAT